MLKVLQDEAYCLVSGGYILQKIQIIDDSHIKTVNLDLVPY